MKNSFYIYIALVIVVICGLVILTFRQIFSAVSISYEIENVLTDAELKIDKDKLNQAHDMFYQKEVEILNVAEVTPVPVENSAEVENN